MTTDDAIRPALRYHGAKFRLAPWIVQWFPPHRCYVEPFGGAAGVLLRKPRAYGEVYNDLDGDVVNFFRVLRDPATRAQLVEAIALTPFAREEFVEAYVATDDPVERARRVAVRASMGFGSAGATKGHTGFRIDTRRKHGTAQDLWVGYPADLAAVGDRFRHVLIEHRPALDVLLQHDAPDTLHFVDPPYLLETRALGGDGYARCYRHEMTVADHVLLLHTLRELKGMVVVCGYPSALYDSMLAGWARRETLSRISAGRGTALRTEVAWLNPACVAALAHPHPGLFDQHDMEPVDAESNPA